MRFIYIILFLGTIYSCRQSDSYKSINGFWYSCDKDDGYAELVADDDYFLGFYEQGPDGQIWRYKIKADTLYFEMPEIDGNVTQWSVIDKFEKNHLVFYTYNKFDKKVRKDELFRLKHLDSIRIDPKLLTKGSKELERLRSQYEERMKINNCQSAE
jgi:hypothetical protein